MNICYIFGALDACRPASPGVGDLVIAADAGLLSTKRLGLQPDLIVGDFDSLGEVPTGDNVICHPVRKDDTDMLLAVRLGLERGYRKFVLYGGLGGRIDHTIANIQTLSFIADRGGRGYLAGADETASILRGSRLDFSAAVAGTVSVFAYGGAAAGVTLTGLAYPLNDAVLDPSFPLGVSNAFTGGEASIQVKDGRLLVIWSGGLDSLRDI